MMNMHSNSQTEQHMIPGRIICKEWKDVIRKKTKEVLPKEGGVGESPLKTTKHILIPKERGRSQTMDSWMFWIQDCIIKEGNPFNCK